MNRIEAIYSFIDPNDKVVDVGCDQAKLSLMLASRNQASIACDISENVINKAKTHIKTNLIDLRVSNGLDNIRINEANTLVLSGMGTHTILEILESTNLRFKKIITISNNYHDILREKMNNLNYIVDKELIIKDKNKYYNLIIFKEGTAKYNREEILFGLNHIDKKLYYEYLRYLLKKYLNIKKSSNDNNPKIDEIINYINQKAIIN